jgi:hypothetical protein
MSTKMNPEIKRLWVEDLRAHTELQGQGELRYENKFCCLGRLCEVYREQTGKGVWDGIRFAGSSGTLPKDVADWAEIDDRDPVVKDCPITYWNDSSGIGFIGIADLIEEYL